MNYPGQQPVYGRPRRKPNFFLLFMLAMMAFFLYSQYQRGKQQAQTPAPCGSGIPDITIPDISNDRRPLRSDPHAQPTPTGGSDWAIDTSLPTQEVEANQTEVFVRPTERGNEIVSRGDWSLEEGSSTASSNAADQNGNLRPAAPKKTREGDWALEELAK